MDFSPSTAQQISEASMGDFWFRCGLQGSFRCNGLRIVYSWVEGSPAEQNAPTSPTSLCNSVNSFSLKTNAETYSLAMLSSPKRWNLGHPESNIFSSIMINGFPTVHTFSIYLGILGLLQMKIFKRSTLTTHLEPLAGCAEVESVSYQDLAS